MDIQESLKEAVTSFMTTLSGALPKIIGFLAVLVIGYFVAKIISRIVGRLLRAIRLDHYLDRAGIGGPLERAGYTDSSVFVVKIIYFLMMLFVLKIAFQTLGIVALEEPFNQLINWIPQALVALVLIVLGGLVANVVRDLVAGFTAGQSYSSAVTNIAVVGVWFIFGMAALDQAKIASDLVDSLTSAVLGSLVGILVIKFGVGGIWAARDHFWPKLYESASRGSASDKSH